MTTTPESGRAVHVVVVVDGDDVWVDGSGALPRLEADYPELAELVPGRVDLVSLAPADVLQTGLPGVTVHVLAPRVEAPLPRGWSLRSPDAVPDAPEVLEVVALEAARWRRETPRPRRRQPWYDADWLPARTRWVDEVLAREGAERTDVGHVLNTWPLSSVVRYAARGADGAPADIVLKGCCEYFAAEPALTSCVAGLAPDLAVETLAVDADARVLLVRAFPHDATEPGDGDLVTTAAALARLQVISLDRRAELVAAGCPDRRLAATREDLVRELGAALGTRAVADLGRLEALGPPAGVMHGDLHRGNVVRLPDGSVRVFDWSDTCWAHPALDVAHLAYGLTEEAATQVWRAWREVWAGAGFEVDIRAVRRLARRADDAHQLLTYRALLPSFEDGTTAGMGGVTAGLRARLVAGRARPDGGAD